MFDGLRVLLHPIFMGDFVNSCYFGPDSTSHNLYYVKLHFESRFQITCSTGMVETAAFWHCTATGNKLKNPVFHAFQRLPIAGVFFVRGFFDSGDEAQLDRTGHHANSEYANTFGESRQEVLISQLKIRLAAFRSPKHASTSCSKVPIEKETGL